MKLGIVGLPNVGKSTLFNAITNAGAESANYPFCTIEPNVGVVAVPDARLDKLAEMRRQQQQQAVDAGRDGEGQEVMAEFAGEAEYHNAEKLEDQVHLICLL